MRKSHVPLSLGKASLAIRPLELSQSCQIGNLNVWVCPIELLMELAFQIVPTVNRVWRDVHIPGEGRFSKRVGKEPQLEVVLGPTRTGPRTELYAQ